MVVYTIFRFPYDQWRIASYMFEALSASYVVFSVTIQNIKEFIEFNFVIFSTTT